MNASREFRPDPQELLRRIAGESRQRATLHVRLGYARGSGATMAMLDEGRRRHGRGTDVVVAAYRVHGDLAHALEGLEVLGAGRRPPAAKRLDVDAVLARNPEVVCVDDLAAPDVEGRPCVESVKRLIGAGITVLASLHVLSIRSSGAALAGLVGVPPGVLDDSVLDLIDVLEFVDITPEELLQRVREERLLSPAELAMAMQGELRPDVLRLLRETALRLTAEHTDRHLREYLPAAPLEFRGHVVFCSAIRAGQEDRIRAAARLAQLHDARFSVVSVKTRELTQEEKGWLGSYAALTHQLGGSFERLEGRNVGAALAEYIQRAGATEVIVGHRRRPPWTAAWVRLPWDTTRELIRRLEGVDVHILRSRSARAAQAGSSAWRR